MASVLGGLGGGREYVLKIVADVKDAIKGVDDVGAKTASMKENMLGVGKAVATGLAAAAVVNFGTDCVNAAADADDAMDAVSSAFGAAETKIIDFSKTAADKMGLSAQDYQTMAAETGRILTGFGISNADAADQTNSLATRAADMAAIVGGSTEDAMGAIDAAMQGQTKGLKKYQINLSKAEVDARAMAEGYVDAAGKVTDAGRAIATQELILDKTNQYQGEFAKNSGDLGSQQDILKAKFENLQTEIGTALLPVVLQLFDVIKPMIEFISNNTSWIVPLVGGILAIVAAVKAWNIVQAILNIELLANPIVLVAAAIAAFVAGLIWAYNNVGWFKDAVDAMGHAVVDTFNWIKDTVIAVFDWIKTHWPLLLSILTGPFGLAVYAIIKNWNTITDFFYRLPGIIGGYLSTVWNIISYPFVRAADIIIGVFNPIKDFFWRLPGQIGTFFSSIADIITYPFKLAFNNIKYLWNTTVGGFGFSLPSWLPGVAGKSFTIPRMATGGIVTRPTIAMIGEAGAEAVIPLNRLASGGGNTYNITVQTLRADSDTGRLIMHSIQQFNRTNGNASAGAQRITLP